MTDQQLQFLLEQMSGPNWFNHNADPGRMSDDQLRLNAEFQGITKPQIPGGPGYQSPALQNQINQYWQNMSGAPAAPFTSSVGQTDFSVEPDPLPSPSPTPQMFPQGMPPGQEMNFPSPEGTPFPTATPYPSGIAPNPFMPSAIDPLTGGINTSYQAPVDLPNTTGNPYAEAVNQLFPMPSVAPYNPAPSDQILSGNPSQFTGFQPLPVNLYNEIYGDQFSFGTGDNPAQSALASGDAINANQFTGIQPLPPDMYNEIYGNPPVSATGFEQGENAGGFTGIQPLPPDIWQQIYGDNSYQYDPGSIDANTTTGGFAGPQDPTMYPYQIQPDYTGDTSLSAPAAPGIAYDETGTQPLNQPGTAPAGPVNAPYLPPQTPITGANGLVGQNPYTYGSPSTQYPVTQGTGPNERIIDPQTGTDVAGTVLSQSDEAKRRNMEQFVDPRYRPSDILHPGQTMMKLLSDGTRVMVDAAGNIIKGTGQAAVDLYHNILNDPRNTGPDYLASIGYQPGQGDASLFPGQVTGPMQGALDTRTGGIAGEGASFFHGNTTQRFIGTDVGPSAMNPRGYNYPVHGPIPVAGAFSGLGAMGTMANVTALSGDIYARKRLADMQASYNAQRARGVATPVWTGTSPGWQSNAGSPGSVFSQSFLKQYPMYKTGPYSGGTPIINPAAFGGSAAAPTAPGRASIHFNPRSPQ